MPSEPMNPQTDPVRDHRRQWRECLYVYPVVSRRSKGLSIGVNLNPDKRCNYACVYCQINRRIRRQPYPIDLRRLREELELALAEAVSGRLWREGTFQHTPPGMRRVNDIAFSGDGEPTCLPNFDAACQVAADVLAAAGADDVKIVVITNAAALNEPQARRALPILDAAGGEIWAKLDAGTDETFQAINRPHPKVTLETVVENIRSVAVGRPVVIQTLLMLRDGQPPPDAEIDAYIDRLRQITAGDGQIKLVQLHTVARPPAEANVAALPDATLDAIADRVRAALDGIPVETYYGRQDVKPQGQ
ncbi:MAG: radical SAM protein [Planctomycetota bacterium]